MSESNSTAEQVQYLERLLLDPHVRRSPERAGALLDASFIEIGSSGNICTRDDVIEAMRLESPLDQRIEDFALRPLAPSLFLATYCLIRDGKRHSWRSSIWRAEGDTWRLVFHQGTVANSDSSLKGSPRRTR
jgi:hypothetical protein